MSAIRLIVGLSNPGKQYAATRHNAGAWFVDLLSNEAQVSLKHEAKFHGLFATTVLHNHDCHLLIPTTFMNLSGQAVRALMNFYKLEPQSLLVVHDDLDLPVGTIKLKFDGGDGGHNGLKDIIRHLHSKQFTRLRIGVGRPKTQQSAVDYVLHQPSIAERHKIDDALIAAQNIVPLLLEGKLAQAMQTLHTENSND